MIGVYFLKDGDKIVYVGASTNVKNRISSHKCGDKEFDSYYVLECNASDLNTIEREQIAAHCPKYNILHRVDIPYPRTKHIHEQKEEIMIDYNKGLPVVKLAKHYMCSYNTMVKKLKAWGAKPNN